MPLDADYRDFVRRIASTERRLFAYVLTLVPNFSDADEILQETHVRLWEERDRYQHGTDFAAWAMRIAYFEVLTYRKKRSRQRLIFDDELIGELSERAGMANQQVSERHEALLMCLSELSDRSRMLLAKIYADGERVKDIAANMGRTAESLYKVVQRLRVTLRKCIEDRLAETGE
jgi:RNA polymerase sigma-70 factor (ECF subfamily)